MVRRDTSVTFLDEFRMMVSIPSKLAVPEFTVSDTLVSRGHRVNSQRFLLPLRYHDWWLSVHVDSARCLGTPDHNRLFITDPTQAVVVVELASPHGERVLIIVWIQTLIKHLRPTGANDFVPWDEWGSGATFIEVSVDDDTSYLLVQGIHVVLLKAWVTSHLRIFDFSRRGCSILPLLDEGDGTKRRVSLEDGRGLLFQEGEDMVEWGLDSVGDGNFVYLVSNFCRRKSGGRLMVRQGRNYWFGRCVARLGAGLRYPSPYHLR